MFVSEKSKSTRYQPVVVFNFIDAPEPDLPRVADHMESRLISGYSDDGSSEGK